jgi:Carboxypeptidase regulatory-like domain
MVKFPCLSPVLAAALSLALPWGDAAGQSPRRDRSTKGDSSYTVIAGSVFQESGFSLPGAAITLTLMNPANAPKSLSKFKKLSAQSDARGEFAFRVPTVSATYVVSASRKGFQSADKEAVVVGSGVGQDPGTDRLDVTLVLAAESNLSHAQPTDPKSPDGKSTDGKWK